MAGCGCPPRVATTVLSNIAEVIPKLQALVASIGETRNALNDKNARAQAAFHHTEQKLAVCINGLRGAPRDLETEQALVAELEGRRAIVLTKQTELEQLIADAPDWRVAGDSRSRDKEYDRQQTVKRQLDLLRAGMLLSVQHKPMRASRISMRA